MKEKEMRLYNSIVKQKMADAGHVLRGYSGDCALQILDEKIEGKLYQGRPRRMWLDDLKEWTQVETYTDKPVVDVARDAQCCVHTRDSSCRRQTHRWTDAWTDTVRQ